MTFEYGQQLISFRQPVYNATNGTYIGSYVRHQGFDTHGSVRLLMASTGNLDVGTDMDYAATGVALNVPVTILDVQIRFAGQMWDPEMGMYYYEPRFYDPVTERWWSMDSDEGDANQPSSLQKYLFCSADPINRMDPSGHGDYQAVSVNTGVAITATLVAITAATIIEAKTHAIENLQYSTGQVGADVLDGNSIAAINATITAEAAIIANYSSFQNALRSAKRTLQRLGNTLKNIKVVPISTKIMPDVAKNISTAQAAGKPMLLRRVSSIQAKINRREALRGLKPAGIGKSLDEYPFASSLQGGRGSRVTPVPIIQNLIQGGIISVSYRLEKINIGDDFWVVVIP